MRLFTEGWKKVDKFASQDDRSDLELATVHLESETKLRSRRGFFVGSRIPHPVAKGATRVGHPAFLLGLDCCREIEFAGGGARVTFFRRAWLGGRTNAPVAT